MYRGVHEFSRVFALFRMQRVSANLCDSFGLIFASFRGFREFSPVFTGFREFSGVFGSFRDFVK